MKKYRKINILDEVIKLSKKIKIIILDKPYILEFLEEIIIELEVPVLKNKSME